MRIEKLSSEHKPQVLALLEQASLPHEDLIERDFADFLAARSDDGSILGVIGLECYENAGLLRSLVVDAGQRGQGLGIELTRELERHARGKGVQTLYLLTTTAGQFFPKLGYQQCDRKSVPAAIAATEEFRSLCPDSAVCLCKTLHEASR